MNLLRETLDILGQNGKAVSDVRWVGFDGREPVVGSWDDFERHADVDYDNGYGGAEIAMGLKIVGDDWWLERGEYDGSEWWEYKTLPAKPAGAHPLRASDLMDR